MAAEITGVQITLLAFALFVLFPGVAMGVYIVPRLLSPCRGVLQIASIEIPVLTKRPLRRFLFFPGVNIVGRDGDCFYLRACFADAKQFGTDAGPPRSYFVYSAADQTITAVTPSEARLHKSRSSWCL